MTATGAAVLNNGHGPMLSNDGGGRTWIECLTHWMAENNLCGGRQTESFILPAKKQLADSQEVVPNTWDTIRQKRQICECASCKKKAKKSQTRRLAAHRFGNLGHPLYLLYIRACPQAAFFRTFTPLLGYEVAYIGRTVRNFWPPANSYQTKVEVEMLYFMC